MITNKLNFLLENECYKVGSYKEPFLQTMYPFHSIVARVQCVT